MATGSTLYRFRLDLSDIDRGVYETLDFRVALHPSETLPFMALRVLAYALNFREGLEFAPGGISDTEEPALRVNDPGGGGGTLLWIEIGKPGTRKLHKAAKASREVKIYTHRNADALAEDIRRERVHRGERIELYAVDPGFLDRIAAGIDRANEWTVLSQDGQLTVGHGGQSDATEVRRIPIAEA